ncbi:MULTISPECIES: hypothetical protein [unclassified Cellulomonas]|uniref:hypothetical protein n=1 Tax=unclassified Cellulomonas TaxID=2620175 RepID=UPI00199F825C|nr:hypothetical protein [Cellulomonas sp. ES6]MBD3779991.1 hypothetical protein [Micrococcales bacterium]WHP16207.1 hypothetical protein P9841_11205 [Cellulomonas sp. ES6]
MGEENPEAARLSAEDAQRFAMLADLVVATVAQVKTVGQTVVMERDLADPARLAGGRGYWDSLSAHFSELARLQRLLADTTAEMAAILGRYGD